MIQKFEISGVHLAVDDDLRKYATRKIGNLDKYLARGSRESAHAEVFLKVAKAKNKQHATCEVNLHLPHEIISVHETTINLYAAIDIVEAKLKQQLQKYKDLHQNGKLHRKLFARLSRKADFTAVDPQLEV
ncbi:MAG: ribosome-associated translation inhibitor RaiA [Patescibacteria group bacterium]|nr:ribosome-associated translation inhibitor RaiA [Patescibacteria group bacterium]